MAKQLRSLWLAILAVHAQQRNAEADRREANEKAAIAKAFNDRYTYRKRLIEGMPYLSGSFYGVPHQAGYAWMCPECNRTHHPVSDSVFSGLQYPACCSRNEGHRLDEGIRTS